MAVSAEMRARIEARVNEGVRDQWYPVAKSVEIRGDRPFGVVALGQKLVMWRRSDGRCSASRISVHTAARR
jgi:phenylpropionate dioxygenase-like ring-hydroxylating dioxygenase large terminal subunit